MNKQEILDTVVTHLRKQGVQSKAGDGSCLYRGPNGTSCAIGCLFTDEEYRHDMETASVYTLNMKGFLPERLKGNIDFLDGLQRIHDSTDNMEYWEGGWKAIAEAYCLDYTPPVDEV